MPGLPRTNRILPFMSAALLTAAISAQGQVKVEEKVPYLGSPNNVRMSNGTVELILTTDYGPRIMRYASMGSEDKDNVFATIPGVTLKTAFGDWLIRGGHRLWHAPEANPRSYEADNEPIQYVIDAGTVKLIQPAEKHTSIQKEVWVTLDPRGSHVIVQHRLTNRGQFAVEMACWGLSAMHAGGTAIIPQEPYQSHDEVLQPARPMVLWAYTNLTDPRWMLGKSFLTLRQDTTIKEAQKIGVLNRQGWAAYFRDGSLFLKRFAFDPAKTYPDYNSNNETFTNDVFLELETLGSLEKVEPGQTITHTEQWWLYSKVDLGIGEAGIAAALQPILAETARK